MHMGSEQFITFISIVIAVIVFVTIITSLSLLAMMTTSIKKETPDQIPQQQKKIPASISGMSYDNITTFIDKLIHFEVSNTILKNGLRDKTDEELSVLLDDNILTISETVYTNISEDIHTVIEYYVTDTYIKNYIKDTTRIVLVASLSV